MPIPDPPWINEAIRSGGFPDSPQYVDHYNLGDYLEAAKKQGLNQDEAEVVWESMDQYEDIRPEEI